MILTVLVETPRHGYAIASEIERLSEDTLKLPEGSLYPALRILEQKGLIKGSWEMPDSGAARKTYAITDSGKVELAKRAEEWRQYARVMDRLLGGGGRRETS